MDWMAVKGSSLCSLTQKAGTCKVKFCRQKFSVAKCGLWLSCRGWVELHVQGQCQGRLGGTVYNLHTNHVFSMSVAACARGGKSYLLQLRSVLKTSTRWSWTAWAICQKTAAATSGRAKLGWRTDSKVANQCYNQGRRYSSPGAHGDETLYGGASGRHGRMGQLPPTGQPGNHIEASRGPPGKAASGAATAVTRRTTIHSSEEEAPEHVTLVTSG